MFPTISPASVRFQAKGPQKGGADKTRRNELISQFPGKPFEHYNGIGSGTVGDLSKGDNRSGIRVMHASAADRKKVIDHLLAQKQITDNGDGLYLFKGTLVKFEVVGVIRPLGAKK